MVMAIIIECLIIVNGCMQFRMGEAHASLGGRRPTYYHPRCVDVWPALNHVYGLPDVDEAARSIVLECLDLHRSVAAPGHRPVDVVDFNRLS